jgi:type I restriction enzyme S subunit
MTTPWTDITLDAAGQWLSGGTPSKQSTALWEGTLPWVSPKDMKRPRIADAIDHVAESAVGNGTQLAPVGSLLMVVRGMILAHTFPVAVTTAPVTFNQDIKALVPGAGWSSEFLLHWLQFMAPEVLRLVDVANHGTKRLPSERLFALSLPQPPLWEQKKIAAILASLDEAIEATQSVINQLQVVKRAMMAELLTRGLPGSHTRFKQTEIGEVPEEWSVVPLGDLCRRVSDGPHFSPKYVSPHEGIPFLSARNVTEDAWALADAKYVSRADHEEFCKRARPEPNDILYTKGGTTGVARVNDLSFEFSIWVHIALLKMKAEAVDSHFLAAALNSEPCYRQSQLMTHGTSNQDLGLTRMVKILVPLPPLQEQRKIATVKQSLASRLETERAYCEGLRTLKTALMSVLLTGEVRVKPDAEAA